MSVTSLSASREATAMRVARRNARLGSRYDQSRDRLAKTWPPPRRMLVRREPARALPVPFCRYIFFVVPATSDRPRVCAEPCRRFVRYITTASCRSCLEIRGASSAGSIS